MQLAKLLGNHPEINHALIEAIQETKDKDVTTLDEFFDLAAGLLTRVPTDKEFSNSTQKFWAILNQSPGDTLKNSDLFQSWVRDFITAVGEFMDTAESARGLDTFIKDPENNIDDYILPRGGWRTFNEFVTRQVKPGKRPVADRCSDDVIVAPTDSTYLGNWDLRDDATIEVKGDTYYTRDLLADSRYTKHFKGGLFTHLYLNVHDYHRCHTPVSGTLVEKKVIPGRTWTNTVKKAGKIQVVDDIGFQFNQTRGYVILETKNIGYVAVVPVGMGFVSSVTIDADKGTELVKGDEFGFFAYGGSDIIMVFEKDAVKFTASSNKHYLQGEKIAKVTR
ncbi:MAG TPA: phosphatidylserine decarboxylase [Chitinophagaceae bacterium]